MRKHTGAAILFVGILCGIAAVDCTKAAAAPARPLYQPTTPLPMPPAKPSFRVGDLVLTVNNTLNQNDAIYNGKRHKLFFVDMEAGKTYQIDMRSTAFDSYLYFESPARQVLAQDDDGGGYPNARITYKVTGTGKFRIIATHFGGGGALGQFEITVRLTSDGAPPKK